MATASNPWLAKSSQPEKKKETSQSSGRLPSPVCEEVASSSAQGGCIKEKLRQDLLKAWIGPEAKKASVEPQRMPEPLVAKTSSPRVEDFAPIKLEAIHPMGRMRAEMQAAAQRTWLATSLPDGKVQGNESSKKKEVKETRALALRKSLLSAWGSQEPEGGWPKLCLHQQPQTPPLAMLRSHPWCQLQVAEGLCWLPGPPASAPSRSQT